MVSVVKNSLSSHSGSCCSFITERTARVEVPVPLWEITTGYLYSNTVPHSEDVGRRTEVYAVLVHLLWHDWRWIA